MKLRHPQSGALYTLQDDALVRVEHGDRVGVFRSDGSYVSGSLRQADPHFTGWVASAAAPERPSASAPRVPGAAIPDRASQGRERQWEPEPPRETEIAAGARSPGIAYRQLLDADTRRVPEVLRWQSARELPEARVPIERYTSQAFHQLEVEKLWKKVWQMACREEEIPEAGDHVVYEIADLSLIILRGRDGAIRAFHNTCLHRGRRLCDSGGRAERLRCPFHGWTWDLEGELAAVPCRWDFPHVERERYRLPEARVGCWGGFVFVNFDPGCESLSDWLGELPQHFEAWPLEQRYKEAHVAKRLACNWKVAQEAFMEAYHVMATHPQLLPGMGDANSQYDAWDHFSRAITPNMTPSPHLAWQPSEQDQLDSLIPRSLDAEPAFRVPDGTTARQLLAQLTRTQLKHAVPGIQDVSDAELADSFYYSVFPNFHPWGAYNKLVYRFRPDGNDAQHCIMDVIQLAPFQGRRPAPAPLHWLGDDEDWSQAPELGFLTRIFNQDTFNLGRVQQGLRGAAHTHVTFARYQETKLRHFHALLDRFLAAP